MAFNNLTVEATDLSATATANTYIVSEAGTYKFKATVNGNGKSDNISLSDIDGVTVLWELNSYGNAIKYQNSAYDIFVLDGYVYFRTPDTFTAGDAYVAVFKDGAGGTAGAYDKDIDEILWSWLIWATDAPATTTVNGVQYLDRNLGSLTTGVSATSGVGRIRLAGATGAMGVMSVTHLPRPVRRLSNFLQTWLQSLTRWHILRPIS